MRVTDPFDRVGVLFDDPNPVANAGLLVPATLMVRLGFEAVINQLVRLVSRATLVEPTPRWGPGARIMCVG